MRLRSFDVRLDDRTAGYALVLGYLGLIGILYRNPASGLETSTASLRGTLYFVVFPALGVLAGGYVAHGGPFGGVLAFVAASYLGIIGAALALAGVASLPFVLAGTGLFALATLALLVSLKDFVAYLGVGPSV